MRGYSQVKDREGVRQKVVKLQIYEVGADYEEWEMMS